MKKSLLSLVAGIAIAFGASAQTGYWQVNYPIGADNYPEWTTVADTFVVKLDPQRCQVVSSLEGTTNFNIAGVSDAWRTGNTRYSLAFAGEELSVTFKPSLDAWANFSVDFFQWGDTVPSAANHNFDPFKMQGYALDMQPTTDGIDNGTIEGEIYVPSSFKGAYPDDKFWIRISIFDAHGHEWNAGGDPIDTLEATEYDTYVPFSFDYGTFIDGTTKMEANPGDGWGGTFHGRKRPVAQDPVRVPLDFSKVVGLRFYFCPAGSHPTATTWDGGVVKIKNLVIGTDQTTALTYRPEGNVSVSEVSSDSPVVSVEVINLLGQTVATVSSIADVTVDGIAILKVTKEDGSVEVVKIAK